MQNQPFNDKISNCANVFVTSITIGFIALSIRFYDDYDCTTAHIA